MIYVKAPFTIFKNNLFISLAIAFLIALSCLGVNTVVVYKQNAELPKTLLNRFGGDYDIYYCANGSSHLFSPQDEIIEYALERGAKLYFMEKQYGAEVTKYGVSEQLFYQMGYILEEGEVKQKSDGVVYGLAKLSSGLKIGDKVEVYIDGVNKADVTISGILSDNSAIMTFTSSGVPMTADILFERVGDFDEKQIYFPREGDYFSGAPSIGYLKIDDKQLSERTLNLLKQIGWAENVANIKQNTDVMTKETLSVFLPLILSSAALLAIMVITSAAMLIEHNKSYLTLLATVGASVKRLVAIVAIYYAAVLLAGGLVCALFDKLFISVLVYNGLYVTTSLPIVFLVCGDAYMAAALLLTGAQFRRADIYNLSRSDNL